MCILDIPYPFGCEMGPRYHHEIVKQVLSNPDIPGNDDLRSHMERLLRCSNGFIKDLSVSYAGPDNCFDEISGELIPDKKGKQFKVRYFTEITFDKKKPWKEIKNWVTLFF